MLDTEAALARALERAGLAAAGTGAEVTAVARGDRFDPAELGRQAARTGNPVPALVRALTSMLPDQAAGVVHRGATSQDIMDTAAMLVARRALDGLLADLAGAATAAANLAAAHSGTIMIGRTLLQQAVPVTFGLVAAGWLTAIEEASSWLHRVRADRLAVQFGGAAGTLAPLGDILNFRRGFAPAQTVGTDRRERGSGTFTRAPLAGRMCSAIYDEFVVRVE